MTRYLSFYFPTGAHKSKSKHRSRNPFCNLHFDKFRNSLSTTRNSQQAEQEEESRNITENTQHIEDNPPNAHRQTQQEQIRHSSKTTKLIQHCSSHKATGLQESKTTREQAIPLLLNCSDTEHACAVKTQNQHSHHNKHYRCPFHKTHNSDTSGKQRKNQEMKNENLNILQTTADACDFLSKSCHDIDDDGQQNTRLDHKQRRHSFPIETVVFIENEPNLPASNL